MSPANPSLEYLRAATCAAHRRLEGAVDIVASLISSKERRRLVERYYDMYSGAAQLLVPWLQAIADLDSSDHRRLNIMREDLQALGVTVGSRCSARPAVEIANRAEALGFRYVIEGSALGGRVILRQLDARGVDPTGLRFLDPHGAAAGEAWRRFLHVLDRELAAEATSLDHAVSGALKGFAFASACLCAKANVA